MTTLDPAVYRKAAHVIREGGLAKGSFAVRQSDGGMAHCTVGALREATGQQELYDASPEVQYLGHLLGLTPCNCGCGAPRVVDWNDRPQTTADDVIALLTEAAEKLEANQP
jgi:hypothetical protein